MKVELGLALILGVVSTGWAKEKEPPPPPPCQDEEMMVGDYRKSIGELVETVKKETQTDFDKAYHQRSTVTKLSLVLPLLGQLEACLDKASQGSAATKDQVSTYKTKREATLKLKDKVDQYKTSLKAATSKEAKGVVEKIELPE